MNALLEQTREQIATYGPSLIAGVAVLVLGWAGRGRYDANMEHHHHFICTACGRVHDFYSPALDDLPIPRSVSSLGRVESAQVQLRGICTNCAKDKR